MTPVESGPTSAPALLQIPRDTLRGPVIEISAKYGAMRLLDHFALALVGASEVPAPWGEDEAQVTSWAREVWALARVLVHERPAIPEPVPVPAQLAAGGGDA